MSLHQCQETTVAAVGRSTSTSDPSDTATVTDWHGLSLTAAATSRVIPQHVAHLCFNWASND